MLKIFLNKIRLFSSKRKEPYFSLYRILGFYPHDIVFYNQALLHKSSSVKMTNGRWINNERLEFLGDAILDAIVADIVFKEFEYKKEGFLTNIRSGIVQRDTLNKLALEIGLDKLVKSSSQNHRAVNTHIYGNALEALIGAIYLDRGYRKAKKFVHEKLILKHINIYTIGDDVKNHKSALIEWGQKNKAEIQFMLTDTFVDENNCSSFITEVLIDNVCFGKGKGHSKKESHKHAAADALNKIKRL